MKKLLTKEEFETNIKPSDNMTYLEIKNNIFSKYPCIELKNFKRDFDLKISQIDMNLNSLKTEKWTYYSMKCEYVILSKTKFWWYYTNFNISFTNFKLSIIDSCRDSYIAWNYEYYILSKFQNLKNSFIWSLNVMDKFLNLVLSTEWIYLKQWWWNYTNIKKLETKDDYIYSELLKFNQKYKDDKNWDLKGKIFVENIIFSEYANNVKHNKDNIIENEKYLILWDYSEFDKISDFFYKECLEKIILFYNDFIELVEKIIDYKYEKCDYKINIKI